MKLIDITCSNCGAEMKVNSELNQCTCNYCGKQMLIDDEIQKHEFVNGYSYGYDLEKGRLQAQEDFKLEQERRENERIEKERKDAEKRAAEEEKRKKQERKNELIKWAKISGGVFVFGLLFCFSSQTAAFGMLVIFTAFGILGYKAYKIYFPEEQTIGMNGETVRLLKFPNNWGPYTEMDYRDVYNSLERIGFTNVRLTNLRDIKIGLLKRDGSIHEIIVNGETIISGGRKYPADIPIEIVYHGRR